MSLFHRTGAWLDLFRHYGALIRHSWNLRHTMRTGFFNKDEAEFLPAGLSLQETPDSPTLHWSGRILMALVVFTLLWAILGRIDIVVQAEGRIIPSARTKTIASVEVASVRALYVKEGQVVQPGEVLLELDASGSDAERDKAASMLVQARLQVARAFAMINALERLRPPELGVLQDVTEAEWIMAQRHLDGQYRDFHAKLMRIDGEIARYAAELPLATQRASDFEALLPDRAVSYHAWLEKKAIQLNLQAQFAEARNQRAALIAQFHKEAQDSISEGNKIISVSLQDQRRAAVRSTLLKLVSPIAGTVQQLTTHTVGGVVPAAQAIMQIVPKENIVEVDAFLANKDIGFVSLGQQAEVKIDAYDYTKYGAVSGSIKHISKDAIQDEKRGLIYAVKIALSKNSLIVDGQEMPLTAGMSVSVAIKTGTRRVIEYILSPLVRHQREVLRER